MADNKKLIFELLKTDFFYDDIILRIYDDYSYDIHKKTEFILKTNILSKDEIYALKFILDNIDAAIEVGILESHSINEEISDDIFDKIKAAWLIGILELDSINAAFEIDIFGLDKMTAFCKLITDDSINSSIDEN